MAITSYAYSKVCDSQRLTQEITNSSIITALDHIEGSSSGVLVFFKDVLSSGDETSLDSIVSAHENTPLPDNEIKPVSISALPEPQPFAVPSFRTKRSKTSSWVTVSAGTTVDIDYTLTEERYVSGGEILYTGAKEGDYVKASVVDANSIIPEAYRAALCEAWPVISEYITGEWIVPNNTNEDYKSKIIDTYPLNAKITPYLVLRVSYTATAETGDRKVAVNYHLTKKL